MGRGVGCGDSGGVRISELEFYDRQGNKISGGTPVCDPDHLASARAGLIRTGGPDQCSLAFDGDPSTFITGRHNAAGPSAAIRYDTAKDVRPIDQVGLNLST